MKRAKCIVVLLFAIVPVACFAQSYTVATPEGVYLVKDGNLAFLEVDFKPIGNINLDNVEESDWQRESFRSLLAIARGMKENVTLMRTPDFYILKNDVAGMDLENVSYFSVNDNISTGMTVEAWVEREVRNQKVPAPAGAEKKWIQLQAMVVRDQIERDPSRSSVELLPSNNTLHTDHHQKIKWDQPEAYYQRLVLDYQECRANNRPRVQINLKELASGKTLSTAAGVRNFKIRKGNRFPGYDEFLNQLMEKGFANDTITLQRYGDFHVAMSSTQVYIIDPYSNQLFEIAADIRKVVRHNYFSSFLKIITKADFASIRSMLTETVELNGSTFYLKFQPDDFHYVVSGNNAFRIRNFGAVPNKKETLAMLAGKVDPSRVVEVRAVDGQLFLLNGSDLYAYIKDEFTQIAQGVRDLVTSLLPTSRSIYVFTYNLSGSIDLVRLDKQSLAHSMVATGLTRLGNARLLTAFLEYNDGLTDWPNILRWQLSDSQSTLIVNYADHQLALTEDGGRLHARKVHNGFQITRIADKPEMQLFLRSEGKDAIWNFAFSSDSTLYPIESNTLYYVQDGVIVRHDSLAVPGIAYNRNFLDELNREQKIDTLFRHSVGEELEITAVKYRQEQFYRLYLAPDEEYFPVRVSNYTEIFNNSKMMGSLLSIVRKEQLRDTIAYSEIDDHQFFTSATRMIYYDYRESKPVTVAASRESLGKDIDFLKRIVARRMTDQLLKEPQRNFSLAVEKTFHATSQAGSFSLYKFTNEERYHVKYVSDTVLTYPIDTKYLEPVFAGDTDFMLWFLSTYKQHTTDVKCEFASDNKRKEYLVFTADAMDFYYSPQQVAHYTHFKCEQKWMFGESAYSFLALDDRFRQLSRDLFKAQPASGDRYKIIGMTQHGILFTPFDEPVNCLEADDFNGLECLTFMILRNKRVVRAGVQRSQLDTFESAVNSFLDAGTFDAAKFPACQ